MSHTDPAVAVILADAVEINGEAITFYTKTLDGLLTEFEGWNGPLHVVTRPSSIPMEGRPVCTTTARADLPFKLHSNDDRLSTVRALGVDLCTALLMPSELDILEADLGTPLVVYAEFNLANRLQYAFESTTDRLDRMRIRVGALRQERRFRRVVRKSAGLQSNGLVAHRPYERLNHEALVFFDSRAHRAEIALTRTSAAKRRHSETLRLAFSGRWVQQKGVLDAVEAFRRARERGLNGHLDIFGSGALANDLPQDDPTITVHGTIPYEPDWVEYVRENVDALLIPHRQGDPSCTYLEGMGCGAPFISYTNDTAVALEGESQAGWTAPMGDVDALANLLLRLGSHRDELDRRREAALAFAEAHAFEDEYLSRAEHLRRIARAQR